MGKWDVALMVLHSNLELTAIGRKMDYQLNLSWIVKSLWKNQKVHINVCEEKRSKSAEDGVFGKNANIERTGLRGECINIKAITKENVVQAHLKVQLVDVSHIKAIIKQKKYARWVVEKKSTE